MNAEERTSLGLRTSIVGIVCNLVLVLAKGVAGIFAGSVSMVADAANNLMDAASNVVTLLGFKLASKPADKDHPYGHGRFEYLAGLFIAVLVIVTGIELVTSAIDRILHPVEINYTALSLASLVFSIVAKLWLMRYNARVGTHIDSQALLAAAQDSRNDALATSAVLVGVLLTRFFNVPADGPLGIAVGAFVLWGGVQLVRETLNPLLGNRPDPELVERVRQKILSYPGVLGTHDLMIHDYGPGHRFASAHVEMAAEENPLVTHEVIDQIERDLLSSEGLATILHYDPIVTKGHDSTRESVIQAVSRIDPELTIHDLGIQRTNDGLVLKFDCVRSSKVHMGDDELLRAIEKEVQALLPDAHCCITLDSGYAP